MHYALPALDISVTHFRCPTFFFDMEGENAGICSGLSTSNKISLLYYGLFIVIFQFGWAIVQISHLALIPELTGNRSERTTLNGLRYLFTVLASLSVYGCVFAILKGDYNSKISSADIESYELLSLVIVCLGCVSAACFHLGTKEESSLPHLLHNDSSFTSANCISMSWSDWFKDIHFYQVGLLYMCSRLYINISQIYFPFYIQYSQEFGKRFVAIFPPVVCATGFLISLLMSIPRLNKHLDRKACYLIGCLLEVSADTVIYRGEAPEEPEPGGGDR